MTKITFKTLADKYKVFEEDIERIFACYDTNDIDGMRVATEYCLFCNNTIYDMQFMFDLIRYIKQCESEEVKE